MDIWPYGQVLRGRNINVKQEDATYMPSAKESP